MALRLKLYETVIIHRPHLARTLAAAKVAPVPKIYHTVQGHDVSGSVHTIPQLPKFARFKPPHVGPLFGPGIVIPVYANEPEPRAIPPFVHDQFQTPPEHPQPEQSHIERENLPKVISVAGHMISSNVLDSAEDSIYEDHQHTSGPQNSVFGENFWEEIKQDAGIFVNIIFFPAYLKSWIEKKVTRPISNLMEDIKQDLGLKK